MALGTACVAALTVALAPVTAHAQIGLLPPVRSVETSAGRLVVNGQPFFPIAIYHAAHWHEGLPEAGAQGFNLVQTYGSSPESFRRDVDDAFSNGMYAAVALNGLCEKLDVVEQIVLACREAPGLLAWLLEDEPNIRLPEPADKPYEERPFRLGPDKLRPVYELITRLDPAHPVWLNLAHGFLADHRAYNSVADIKSDDIYPVPEVALPAVAAYADAIVAGAGTNVPWIILQMAPVRPQLGDKDRAPTITEARCMTYMALAHGCTGVGYYSFNERPGYDWRIPQTAPALWAQWADLTAELRALSPWLLAPEAGKVSVELRSGPAEPGPWGFAAIHTSLRRGPDGWLLIAVNGLDTAIQARMKLPEDVAATQAAVRFEARLTPVSDGAIEDSFAPYAVHLYQIVPPETAG